ncbi:hypothetical protein [Marinobacter caseinilyticus]|uniref:hypothetical protein n=1 Tax=Marinobacter caseinilyticus TaxID=2692195 RepID=UPI0014091D3D|nr:hypothetical protein [Marinobacter caseinilyticus]
MRLRALTRREPEAAANYQCQNLPVTGQKLPPYKVVMNKAQKQFKNVAGKPIDN